MSDNQQTDKRTDKETAARLLAEYPKTYAEQLGIDVGKNTPSALFRLMCFALLSSARISAGLALAGARALADAGLTTTATMSEASWEERTRVLNESGYARYDERTSTMLGDTSSFLLDTYRGDLRKLRERADRDPTRERKLLQDLKGIGPVGADIFLREVQAVWDELLPYVDQRAAKAAAKLGLPTDATQLARLVSGKDLPRLVSAVVQSSLSGKARKP